MPQLCVYHPPPAQAQAHQVHAPTARRISDAPNNYSESRQDGSTQHDRTLGQSEQGDADLDTLDISPSHTSASTSSDKPSLRSLANVFGYSQQSSNNTLALVNMLLPHEDSGESKDIAIPGEASIEIQKALNAMPDRLILDFLVKYFVARVNWIEQLLCPSWLLTQYRQWWMRDRVSSVADAEFAVLFLSVCSYASHFLPSPTCTIDSIKGMALVDIRRSCDAAASTIASICARLDPRGSLKRVQHIAFTGLRAIYHGQMDAFWEAVCRAVCVCQNIGLHAGSHDSHADEVEKEMMRRTFCNLYIWDSQLSRRLDRATFLPDSLGADTMPQMRFSAHASPDGPDVFADRIIQTHLSAFWRSFPLVPGEAYSGTVVEERYEAFCTSFLPSIPPAFALLPDMQWDAPSSCIPMQRQLVHMALFESLCYNFKPVLTQLPPDTNEHLPEYKRVLVLSHRKALAAASLSLLRATALLHSLMGGSQTRFAGLIVPAFEAAVFLSCLCSDPSFPEAPHGAGIPRRQSAKSDPLHFDKTNLTREECMRAVYEALERLQTYAHISNMAELAAQTLRRIVLSIDASYDTGPSDGFPAKQLADPMTNNSDFWGLTRAADALGGDSLTLGIMNDEIGDVADMSFDWNSMLQNMNNYVGSEGFGFADVQC